MRLFETSYLGWLLLSSPVLALVGFEQAPYDPVCAFACTGAIGMPMLSCSDMSMMSEDMMEGIPMTSPDCYASNTPFLTTVAWCIRSKCDNVPASKLELFWEQSVTGDPMVQPNLTYGEALGYIKEQPTQVLGDDGLLNYTALVDDSVWSEQSNTLANVEREEAVHARYGVALLVTGFALPVVLTWAGYLPYMTGIIERLQPYVVYPALIGRYQVRALPYFLGNAPTTGHALYIALIVFLNVILTAVNYKSAQPNVWYANRYQEVLAYVMWRTGTYGFAMLPLLILFAGRNNVLLWLSNWSHSTFLLLHRWIARIFGIHVIIHSITALILYIDNDQFAMNEKMPWWIWGVVATLTTVIMLVSAGLYARRWSYEVFLIVHIVLAIFTIVGCWYHIIYHFGYSWGQPQWLYMACAVWFFDRLMRVGRILKNGLRRATVSEVGEGHVRIDIKGVRCDPKPGMHVYVYLPTLNPLKPWENHPFSMLPTAMLQAFHNNTEARSTVGQGEIEKSIAISTTRSSGSSLENADTTAGITFFVKKHTGMTKMLKANGGLLTLLDGPYPNNDTSSVMRCDRLLLIGGGIGISGLFPWLRIHPNAKLFWSVKESGESLVQSLDGFLSGVPEKDVRVGQRFDVQDVLDQEVSVGWAKIGVVVCGPGGLCDDVRAAVVAAARNGPAVFELEVDAYSW